MGACTLCSTNELEHAEPQSANQIHHSSVYHSLPQYVMVVG
jgi:hypothetical protein